MPRLDTPVTVKFQRSEKDALESLARGVGKPLRTFIREQVLGGSEVTKETGMVMVEQRRLWELLVRLWEWSTQGQEESRKVREIAEQVRAIDGRVLVAREAGARR